MAGPENMSEVPQSPEVPPRLSLFQQELGIIDELKQQQPSVDRDLDLLEAIERKNNLLLEANRLGLFNDLKTELSGVYYSSRVTVTNAEKEGRGEFRGGGKLLELRTRRQTAYDPNKSLERDQTDAASGERRIGFWSNPLVRDLQQQFAAGGNQINLEARFRGAIDYFNQQSLDIIREVVRDRNRYTSSLDFYPDSGITGVWDGPVRDSAGHILKDPEDAHEIIAGGFNDVRAAIEEARRQEPWVPNYRNYENYIQFVADDVEELEEMIPYIVARVQRKLGTGLPEQLHATLGQEKQKIDGALAIFRVDSEREFRRLKSTLADNLNLMGAYFFSDKVQDDWQPYLAYMNYLATATEDTEQQDHLVDALILDRDGLTMLACTQFSQNDGLFWRYGQTGANLAKEVEDTSKLFRWQVRRKKEINDFLMNRKLKPVKILLGFTTDQNGSITGYGAPAHPAFQRLKVKLDALDATDIRVTATATTPGYILDVDNQPTKETRWVEYCKKALEWEKTGRFSDPREAERVIFQHPLARSFKEPTKSAQGQIQSELLDMFEKDKQVGTDRWHASTKRRKVKRIMEKAERISRAFMLDSAAALAWHVFRTPEQVIEVNEYLKVAGMDPITSDEAVPQKKLFRALMQACIREDKTKPPKDRNFKMYDLLTELMGIDLDIPTFASWYLGWHDTNRPAVILQTIKNDKRPGGLQTPGVMPARGMDEKNTGTKWAERERRIRLLMQMVMKGKFGQSGQYFNYPGHDTRGAGVKDMRNYLNLMYGTSRDTSWLNDLLDGAIPLEQEFTGDHGLTRDPITQYVGMSKGGDEVMFAQSGYAGLIENPRDFKAWVKRTDKNVENSKRYTSGDKEDGYALMNDGPISGGYLWRDYNLANYDGRYTHPHKEPFFATNKAREAIADMTEATYRAGIDLAAQTIKPLIKVMRNTIDSTQGKNPGSARFANTLLWYAVSKWMDTSWEFREKPGYAVDANLHTARYFMHQYLLEYGNGGLIYDDKSFDEIMLGTVRVEEGGLVKNVIRYEVDAQGNTKDHRENIIYQNPDSQGDIKDGIGNVVYRVDDQGNIWDLGGKKVERNKVVLGEINEGLIDAFPKNLRQEIIKGKDKEIKDSSERVVHRIKDYWLPFGLNSKFPETFANYYRDSEPARKDYEGALIQVRPRTKVTRAA